MDYLQTVIDEDIPKLSASAKRQIAKAIWLKLATHPVEFGKPLRYSLKGARCLRVVDYRVIYKIQAAQKVLIVKIGHRRDVYQA